MADKSNTTFTVISISGRCCLSAVLLRLKGSAVIDIDIFSKYSVFCTLEEKKLTKQLQQVTHLTEREISK